MSGKRNRRKDDVRRMFVGLDLHKKYSEYAIMDIGGALLRQGRIENNQEEMKAFSESIPASSSVVIESSSTWYWAHRLLSERHTVTLANPIKNKAIASAKVKTDTYVDGQAGSPLLLPEFGSDGVAIGQR